MDRRALERAALAYLGRYASSAVNMRRVLMRKIARSARAHGTDTQAGADWVEELIQHYESTGLLDDARHARAIAERLHARGASSQRIRAALANKGIEAPLIVATIASLREEVDDAEYRAACTFARRRRLGPYRPKGERAERQVRDLGAFARAGFAYPVARRVLAAESVESLRPDDQMG